MIEGKTSSGFEFKIEDDALNDYEMLEILDELDDNPQKIAKVATMLLGKDQHKALKEHCRGDNGRVSIIRITEEITDIFNSNSETKN